MFGESFKEMFGETSMEKEMTGKREIHTGRRLGFIDLSDHLVWYRVLNVP